MINIPFDKRFREPMLNGGKTMTTRTRRYGDIGDRFEAWGQTFKLTLVWSTDLLTIRDSLYTKEGCKFPVDFERVWSELHPRKGFVPEQIVWVHEFKRVKALAQLGG